MHLPFDFILTEIWHMLDVSAVAGHGAVLAVLLFFFKTKTAQGMILLLFAMTGLEKMLHNICISAVVISLGYFTQVSELWPVGLLFIFIIIIFIFKKIRLGIS